MMFDAGLIDLTDNLNTSANTGTSEYFYNLDFLFKMGSAKRWDLGWSIFGISQHQTLSSGTISYSSFDMGPVVRWNIDRANIYSMSLAYGYFAKGNYNNSTSSSPETWNGTSYRFQFSAQVPLNDQWSAGFSLNYYMASYSQKVISSVESSNNATKNWLFPMFSVTWRP